MSSFLDGLKGVYQGGLQGSTYGWGDEIQGAIGSALARALKPDLFEGEGFSDTYKKGRDLARAMAEQVKTQSPTAYNAAEFLTGIAAPTKMLGAAGSLSGAAKTGGLFGALSGAGYSEKDTASGVGLDAGISALASALAAPIIQKTAQKVAHSRIMQDEFGGVNIWKKDFIPEELKTLPKESYEQWQQRVYHLIKENIKDPMPRGQGAAYDLDGRRVYDEGEGLASSYFRLPGNRELRISGHEGGSRFDPSDISISIMPQNVSYKKYMKRELGKPPSKDYNLSLQVNPSFPSVEVSPKYRYGEWLVKNDEEFSKKLAKLLNRVR